MPSAAYLSHLTPVLADADELDAAHRQLRTGLVGRQWGLGSFNRAIVVMCISAWETYVEEVAKEAVGQLRPAGTTLGVWPALEASVRTMVGRFNNPTVDNTKSLIANSIGLEDVTTYWSWRNNTTTQAKQRLTLAIRFRHEVAHGSTPRPTVHNSYSSRLPGLFRQLGKRTDYGIRDYFLNTLEIASPWP